jgi:Lysylphosphatidylglycerol synthase TM region
MTWFIVNQLFIKNDFTAQLTFCIQHLQGNRFWLFIFAIALMPLNWGLETVKWKVLLRSHVSYSRLVKSIIAGITIGFVTPGRSGEFAGRVLFLNDDKGTKVFYLSSIGGLAQTAASLVIGAPFVLMWSNDVFITEIVTACGLIYLLVFFRFDLLNKVLSSWSFLQRYGLVIEHTDLPVIETQLYVLLLSAIRFLIYSMQYVLLLMFFGVGNNVPALLTHSIVYLLAQTFSPLMPLLDFSYRGASALYVFKDFPINTIAILSTVMIVWLVNLVAPAVIGYFYILKRRVIYLPRFGD